MRNASLLAHELFRLRLKCFYEVQPSSPPPESPAMRTLSKKAARNFHALGSSRLRKLRPIANNAGARMKLGDRVRVKCTAIQYPGRCGIVLADSAPGELVEVEFEDEAIAHLFTEDELEPLLDPAHHYLEGQLRVLVVDDFEPFRRFVCSTLGKRRDLQVIGEASDGLEAVCKAEELKPEMIVIDIGLPTLSGIEVARRIRELCPECKILFLSQESSAVVAQEAFSLGAMGYVVKAYAGSELSAAVEAVCQGRQFVSKGLLSHNWTTAADAQAPPSLAPGSSPIACTEKGADCSQPRGPILF